MKAASACLGRRIVGGRHLKLALCLEDEQLSYDGIAFNMTDEDWEGEPVLLEAVYQLDVNRYRGEESVQLIIKHLKPVYQHS